ncbi:AIM24 family protein [Clostridium paraputrificum]|uniref:AIM24 family protein n=1 Tax=Clostridium paraputrificum TaxID=29363 RepID=UPI00189AEFC0|nr:AIM24 family protein [Clostridium paraputrificum]MDB2123641.1 AIM24 family protein [Clostridium paraputrificum]
MRTSMNIQNKLTMLSEMRNDSKFQILEFDRLEGATDVGTALGLQIMNDSGIKLRQVRIILEDSSVKLESGALSYMKGEIEIKTKTGGVVGLGKKFLNSKLTGETMFKPTYEGTGEIFLEPSFGQFALIELEDEEIIVDDGLFYACEEDVEVGAAMQKSVSSMLFGNEGIYQTSISGSGIVVLEIPVPESEIFKCKLFNDTLKVDGNFAVLRTSNIKFTVEKSSSLIGSVTNGEGLLNVYSGTGEVWLLPTMSIYQDLRLEGLNSLANPEGSRNTEV